MLGVSKSIGIAAAFPALACAALLLVGAPAFSQNTTQEPKSGVTPSQESEATKVVTAIDIKPGDTWVYNTYNEITGELRWTATYIITEMKEKTVIVQYSTVTPRGQHSGEELQIYDDNWNLVERTSTIKFDFPSASMGGLHFPLKVGTEWASKYRSINEKTAAIFSGTSLSKVVAREPVILRSGESYDTYKIETIEQYTSAANSKKSENKTTSWFAQDVNKYVKLIYERRVGGRLLSSDKHELVSYRRRAD